MEVDYNDLPELVKKIRSHLVLIYDSDAHESGSGVIVKIKDRIFVLTAAHVCFNNININLGYPWQISSPTILEKWINKELDIGFIELKPFDVNVLKYKYSEPYFIAKENKNKIETNKRTIAICGYPVEKRVQKENITGFIPVFLACKLIHPKNWPQSLQDNRKSPDNHIAIPYGPKLGGTFWDIKGNPLKQIDPRGFSGCGIWYYSPNSEQLENPSYALLGIQTSYFRQSQILIGTYLKTLMDVISKKYDIDLT